jgi:hypothetical protein
MIAGIISVGVMTVGVLSVGVMTLSQIIEDGKNESWQGFKRNYQ